MNEIWFCGLNENQKLLKSELKSIIPFTKIQFENENENQNQNQNQLKQISTSKFSTIFLFENGKAIKYLNEENSKQNPEEIEFANIQKITNGEENESVLTSEGIVFAKGKDINSENPYQFINISSLIDDPNDRIIEDIVGGANSIYLLTSNHNAYEIDSKKYRQIDSKTFEQTQKPVLMMKNISKIFSGNFSHCVFLLDSNQELFGNEYDFLGGYSSHWGSIDDKFKKLQNIPKGKIIDIQSGNYHSVMLIEEFDFEQNPVKKVYSQGYRLYNGLGKRDEYEHTYEFTEIKSPLFENDDILDFSVGHAHTLILTSQGKMIGFGSNFYGQLNAAKARYKLRPIQIELPKLKFNEEISNYHLSCGYEKSFLFLSWFSRLEEDLIKLFRRKEFCNISFKTENGEIIEAHKLILKYRLKDYENEIEKLQEIISKKSIKESNQIFEMIYSNKKVNPKLYSEIKEIINSNEKIEETMKRIYLNENEKDFIIERKEKQYKFHKLILIMRSELYRGMFLSVTNDTSNKVTDYSELSNESFQIFEYWIYSNQIKKGIQITQEIIDEIKIGIDYFQLNQTKPNLFDLLIKKFNN
ncbi:hypothetical protein M0811_14372 [Anaeramoeba ignava]|uniref:BTB domain-containing protein n=1 Tax=Anaeramoeba ignava TaxID=1746090 RepID=A0A9Q0LW17_ANAIG|nr:hypothetical protein M0811_14372 [Anaeramoeba ignava]